MLPFVSEKIIDAVGEALDKDDAYEIAIEEMAEQQPAIVALALSEDFQAFSEEERDFFLYLALIMWKSASKVGTPATATPEAIEAAEEVNWAILEQSSGPTFHDRLDPFFDNPLQEDLLAFIEDAVSEDEEDDDNIVTKEGREAMFISLKSVMDVLIA
ncbi:MAG: hypothetical protein SH848_18465 [Saprospiraceae bacterium]|nr:hypothetical protein [Saprospiraceae bacterium]MDZ4705917.1 hypothetical protein [Saprospiraceae bacterium]